MRRKKVDSSNLASVGYHAPSKTLEIRFHKGHIYSYDAVPAKVHTQLMVAASKGKYFHKKIKNAYAFKKV